MLQICAEDDLDLSTAILCGLKCRVWLFSCSDAQANPRCLLHKFQNSAWPRTWSIPMHTCLLYEIEVVICVLIRKTTIQFLRAIPTVSLYGCGSLLSIVSFFLSVNFRPRGTLRSSCRVSSGFCVSISGLEGFVKLRFGNTTKLLLDCIGLPPQYA